MLNKVIFVVMTVMCGMHGFGCSRNDSVVSVSVREFEREIRADSVQLLDVRTPEEYADGHIDGAININVRSDEFGDLAVRELSRDSTVLVYCRSGRRSLVAAEMLAKLGYRVVNLEGGIIDWEENGLPVVDSKIVGVYEDRNDGSTLAVSKGDDGKYKVEVGLVRLTQLDGEGEITDRGLTFSATDASGNPINGAVVIRGDTAILTITSSTWDYLPEGSTYRFERR